MKTSTVEIGTILSHRTKQGMVEFVLNSEKTQWDLAKAREIHGMLGAAIEAAVAALPRVAAGESRDGLSAVRSTQYLAAALVWGIGED